MTPKSPHSPPRSTSTRIRCPVCHEAVYSRGNIHPQCAVQQSETAATAKRKAQEAALLADPLAGAATDPVAGDIPLETPPSVSLATPD